MYSFSGEHFITSGDKIIFQPQIDLHDYEVCQAIYEAERNIGALARLGLKNHPLRPTILRNSIVRTAHFTTKIEQNKLDFKEVEALFDEYKKLSPREKTKIEVANVFAVYEYLYSLRPDAKFGAMDETVLKKIHLLLMKGLSGHPEGYRLIPVSLEDSSGDVMYVPPAFPEVPRYMASFFEWLFTAVTGLEHAYAETPNYSTKVHPLLVSAITHHLVGYIHPFPDGNGRTARAYSTLVGLIHTDLASIKDAFSVEEFIDKYIEEYYETLLLADKGDLKPFVLFYLRCINLSLTKVLRELQRYDRIKHFREVLGQGNARIMLEMLAQLPDGQVVERRLFDQALKASKDSITKNLKRLRELGAVKIGVKRGEYIVSIGE